MPTASRRLSTGSSLSFSAVMLCLVVDDLVSMRFSARTSISSKVLVIFCAPKSKLRTDVAPALTWMVWTCLS